MATRDEWGGVEVAEPDQDEFGGVAITDTDEFGGMSIEDSQDSPTQNDLHINGFTPTPVLDPFVGGSAPVPSHSITGENFGIPGGPQPLKELPNPIAETARQFFFPDPTPEQSDRADVQARARELPMEQRLEMGRKADEQYQNFKEVIGDPTGNPEKLEKLNSAHQRWLAAKNAAGTEVVDLGTKPLERLSPNQAKNLFGVGDRTAKNIANIQSGVSGVTESFADPLGLAMLTGPAKLAKPLATAFVADMAKTATEKAAQAAGHYSAGDRESGDAALTEAAATAAMLGLPLLKGKGKPAAEQLATELSKSELNKSELTLQELESSRPKAEREIGLRLDQGENALGRPDIAQLADRALQQGPNPPLARGDVSALERIRQELNPPRLETVEPTRVAERIEGGGEAPYGKASFQRTAEAPTAARTRAARAASEPLIEPAKAKEAPAAPKSGKSAEGTYELQQIGATSGEWKTVQKYKIGDEAFKALPKGKGWRIKPPTETITPANDTSIGKNSGGEQLYQRADGSVYRMQNGRPNFGGDLAQVEGSLRIGENRPTNESVLEMTPEQYFEASQQWARDSMAGKGEPVQIQAELAALRDPNIAKWKEGYAKASQEAAAVKAEVKANPQSMGDPAVQKRFGGAAQKAQFFSEGLKVLEGTEPNARTKAALEREQALSAGESPSSAPITLRDVASEVTKFETEFPGAPKINIAPDFDALPKSAKDLALSVGSDPSLIDAYVKGGEVWINAGAITSPAMVKRLALHETGGHWAVDRKLGEGLQRFMEQAHDSWTTSGTMKSIRERYPNADKVTLGRELVARLAEEPTLAPNIWNRIVAQFRQWLREAGFVKKVSENDIQALITGAVDGMRKVERGEGSGEGMLSLKSAAEKANERFPVQGAGNVATPPPVKPPTTAGAAPAASGRPALKITLDDIYKIFEPENKTSPTLKERGVKIAEAFRTGVSSKFRPVNKLAEDIAKSYGRTSSKDIAGIMEQLKGSQGKGEAEVYRFDRDVSKLVEGSEKDFNAYIFLRRSLDRLNQDAADIAKAQAGGNVPQLNRRAVAGYTINELTPKLQALEAKLGPDKLANFEKAANEYQRYMDDALRLQVESGRMAPEVYAAIKEGNQFYAPFKVMKYLEENSKPSGSGKRIDTVADYTKAMKGIEDEGFKLGDMLGAARQSIIMSRILADKNTAMRHVAELAPFDVNGTFIKKLAQDVDAPRGFEAVNVLENGKQVRYAVRPEVAEAIQLYGGNAGGVVSRMLGAFSAPFRAGATVLNLPFQVSNLLADIPRQALVSKYGITGMRNLFQYPMDFAKSLLASIQGDVFGKDNKLFLDFLDSGVAGTTVQEYLTPNALKFQEPSNVSKSKKLASSVLGIIPKFAQAIEQTSKVLGVKRAMLFEGVESGKELAKQIPEAITELRRFSGSPDFGRQGQWVEQARLNLLYMFLNARIQGAIADIGRLGGRDGASTAAQTWLKIGTAVGIPTAYLYYLNQRPEFKEDYDKRPLQEKQNYWLIPKDSYITNDDGEKMRDYWRIPKREVSKWMANLTESALSFAQKRDPKAALDFGASMIQEISPVNIQGENTQERLESVAASLNPLLKAPLELASGRDLYRHRTIVPDTMKNASPEEQYTPLTAEAFKKLAVAMPDVAPEFLRSPLVLENLTRNLTAGLLTQFLPRKPVEGRSGIENNPLLSRFQALPYSDNSEFKNQIQELERNAADEQLARHRQAVKLMDANKKAPLDKILDQAPKDEKLMRHIIDLYIAKENGVMAQERQLLALPTKQRAAYIANQIQGLSPEKQNEAILEYARKRILTEDVFQQLPGVLQK